MVVADNEVDALFFGVCNLIYGLDAAVEHDNQFYPAFVSIVDSFDRHAIPFFVTVGDIIVDIGIILLQELVDQCYGRATVYVIISINHDSLLASQSFVQALYGPVHIGKHERVVQPCERGTEEFLGIRHRRDIAFYQETTENRADVQLFGQSLSRFLFFRCRRF